MDNLRSRFLTLNLDDAIDIAIRAFEGSLIGSLIPLTTGNIGLNVFTLKAALYGAGLKALLAFLQCLTSNSQGKTLRLEPTQIDNNKTV